VAKHAAAAESIAPARAQHADGSGWREATKKWRDIAAAIRRL
jgi:hypothetical protein